MAKKVIYQVTRHKIQMVEVHNEQEEQAVILANRDFERMEKKDQREREHLCSLDKLMEENGFDVADDSMPIDEQVIEMERQKRIVRIVRAALSTLTERQRQVLMMLKGEEKTYREVAEELKIDISSVRDAYRGGRKKFITFFANLRKTSPQNGVKMSISSEGVKKSRKIKEQKK